MLSSLLEKEIGYIFNDTLSEIVKKTLDDSPDCIEFIPASSSGKYHPKADLGEGGLVRHIKTVTAIAYSFFDSHVFRDMVLGKHADFETLQVYQDAAIAACICHDCCKAKDDDEKHTTIFEHPLFAAELFKKTAKIYLIENKSNISKEDMQYMKAVIPLVYSAIASHMGKWNTSKYAKGIVLPEPETGLDNFVHMCDYIASRKFIDFNFEVYGE